MERYRVLGRLMVHLNGRASSIMGNSEMLVANGFLLESMVLVQKSAGLLETVWHGKGY